MPGKRSKVREDAVVRRARGEAAATRGLPRVVPEEYAARPEAAEAWLRSWDRETARRYHPDKNRGSLPPVRSVEDLDRLPWGGNAWWDLPIMRHIDRSLIDETLPREVRIAISERAGFLLTGENCDYSADYSFDDHLAELRSTGLVH